MGVDLVDCPSCKKQIFNRNFCIFCGLKLKGKNFEQDKKFDIALLEDKLQVLLDLKNKFEGEQKELKTLLKTNITRVKNNLSNLESVINEYHKRLDEIKVLFNLEEISKSELKKESDDLDQKISQNQDDIKVLKTNLNDLIKLFKRIPKFSENKNKQKIIKKKITKKISDLDIAYKEKKIGSELYQQLKSKYENQLKGPTKK